MINMLRSGQNTWCKFQPIDTTSFIIQLVQLFTQFVLVIAFIYFLQRRRSHEIKITQIEQDLYSLLLCWCYCAIMKSFINSFVYTFENKVKSQDQLKYFSAASDSFAALMAYFLHSLLFNIFTLWLFNIFQKIDDNRQTNQQCLKIHRTYKIMNKIRGYKKYRKLWIIVFIGVQIMMVCVPQMGQITSLVIIIILNAQAIAIVAAYTFGLFKIRQFYHLIVLESAVIRQIIKEYKILLICCISRLVFNIVFMNINFDKLELNQHCRLINRDKQPLLQMFLWYSFFFPGYFMNHYLAIISLLKFYWPSQKGLFRYVHDVQSLPNSNINVLFS